MTDAVEGWLVWPFLIEIFTAMPTNARLRELLSDFYLALFIQADSIPPVSPDWWP